MGDRLWVGKPSQYITSHLGQLSLPSIWGRLIKYQSFWLGLGRALSLVSALTLLVGSFVRPVKHRLQNDLNCVECDVKPC